jgi:hypothetical protein
MERLAQSVGQSKFSNCGRLIQWYRPMLSARLLSVALSAFASIAGANEVIDPGQLREIRFEKIPPTTFQWKDSVLTMKVNQSSGALVRPFDQIRSVRLIQVEWQTTFDAKGVTAKSEQKKNGDDFPLRIGLIVSGPKPWIPMFAAKWIKLLTEWMKFPSDRMIYAVLGSTQPPGSTWTSPYSDSIENIALPSVEQSNGYLRSTWDLKELKLVGYWIMSDGDDRKISFETNLRSLVLD